MVQRKQNKKYETAQKLLHFSVEALLLSKALLSLKLSLSSVRLGGKCQNGNVGVLPSMLIKEEHRNNYINDSDYSTTRDANGRLSR